MPTNTNKIYLGDTLLCDSSAPDCPDCPSCSEQYGFFTNASSVIADSATTTITYNTYIVYPSGTIS